MCTFLVMYDYEIQNKFYSTSSSWLFFVCVFLLVLEGILMRLSRPGENNNGKKSFKAQNVHDECMETFDHNFLSVYVGLIIDKY